MNPAPPVTKTRMPAGTLESRSRRPFDLLVSGRGRLLTPEADAHQIRKVPKIAAHEFEPAVSVVPPSYWYLRNAVSRLQRQGEDFDIEHVAVDALPTENVHGGPAAEELEPALRIDDVREPDNPVHAEGEDL